MKLNTERKMTEKYLMSTLVATLLTFWPPGPELELYVILSSSKGGAGEEEGDLATQKVTHSCLTGG